MEENTICVTATLKDFEKALDALLKDYRSYNFYLAFEEVVKDNG